MRNRCTALNCTVPMDYSIDAPVNHGDRIRVEITERGVKRMATLRRANEGDKVLIRDLEGRGWMEEGSAT